MSAVDRLLDRLRPIWPDTRELRVVRLPLGTGEGVSYLVLPTLAAATLLVPERHTAVASALRRADDGQRRRALFPALALAHRTGLLRLAPLARVRLPSSGGAIRSVTDVVPATTSVVVRLGRPRQGRTVVLQALDASGRTLAYAKCASGASAGTVRHERARLEQVGPEPVPGLRAPRVLGAADDGERSVLVLEALLPQHAVQRGSRREPPVAAMQALAVRDGTTHATVARAPVVVRLREAVGRLGSEEHRTWLAAELDRLVADSGETELALGEWHGDWVGWNMAHDGDTVLLWDWEHHEAGVPLGADHLHHLAQELRMRVGTSPKVEDTWVARATEALIERWGTTPASARATLRLYLLMVNVRFVSDRDGDPTGGTTHRTGWSRGLLERLGPADPLDPPGSAGPGDEARR